MGGGLGAVAAAGHPTLTSSFRYTLSLLGAVLAVFLLRPPALRSIPCRQTEFGQFRDASPPKQGRKRAGRAHHGCCFCSRSHHG